MNSKIFISNGDFQPTFQSFQGVLKAVNGEGVNGRYDVFGLDFWNFFPPKIVSKQNYIITLERIIVERATYLKKLLKIVAFTILGPEPKSLITPWSFA